MNNTTSSQIIVGPAQFYGGMNVRISGKQAIVANVHHDITGVVVTVLPAVTMPTKQALRLVEQCRTRGASVEVLA